MLDGLVKLVITMICLLWPKCAWLRSWVKISSVHVMQITMCRAHRYICMPGKIVVVDALRIVYENSRHKITCIKLVSLLIGPNLIVLTLTDGKVLDWFKSLERGNS